MDLTFHHVFRGSFSCNFVVYFVTSTSVRQSALQFLLDLTWHAPVQILRNILQSVHAHPSSLQCVHWPRQRFFHLRSCYSCAKLEDWPLSGLSDSLKRTLRKTFDLSTLIFGHLATWPTGVMHRLCGLQCLAELGSIQVF